MMKPQVIRGSKQEIDETVAQINGEVREAIVFVEEPSDHIAIADRDDIFAEMEPFTVRVGNADYSRESLYTPLDGE